MTENSPEPGGAADPAAISLALGAAAPDPRLAARAESYLQTQQRLGELQCESLANKEKYEVSHLRLRRFSDYAKAAFEASIGLLALALVAGIAIMVWSAAHTDGLIVESFAVPPDLAARGLSGQVVASRMLDQLSDLQTATTSVRSAKSYANNWGDDLKVEIPETGVSLGEAWRFLRGWLGHETHIGGEIVRTGSGIAVTARIGSESGATFTGAESDLDALVQKAAERIYSVTQPYRYGWFLRTHDRIAEAKAVYRQLVLNSDANEQSWAWHGLAVVTASNEGKFRESVPYEHKAIELPGAAPVAYFTLGRTQIWTGHAEEALANSLVALRIASQRTVAGVNTDTLPDMRTSSERYIALLLGDYTQLAELSRRRLTNTTGGISPQIQRRDLVRSLAGRHDAAGAQAAWAALPPPETAAEPGDRALTRLQADAALADWQSVAATEAGVEKTYVMANATFDTSDTFNLTLRPLLAQAKAKLGDVAGAQGLIAQTPGDCYDCVRIRGIIATEAKQGGRADYWFAKAVHDAPSIPFAYEGWGRALLARGKADDAIAQFTLANKKGPHFADPLEGWGEALMAKNQSHLAPAKFAQAEKFAPNWGRLHLKWGEALAYAGKPAEARAHFARAAALDLTASEKSELARHP